MALHARTRAIDNARSARLLLAWTEGDKLAADWYPLGHRCRGADPFAISVLIAGREDKQARGRRLGRWPPWPS